MLGVLPYVHAFFSSHLHSASSLVVTMSSYSASYGARRAGGRGSGRGGRGGDGAAPVRGRGRGAESSLTGPTRVSCVQPDMHLSKKALRSYMGENGPFFLEGASSAQEFFSMDAVSATRTPLNCEWHRRLGFALSFFGANVTGGTEALHEIPGVAELTQFMETGAGREFSAAASYLNIKNGCARSSEATRDHLQSLLNFLGENLDALHSAAVAMVEPTAKLYLFATSLIEVLSLLASLQAWADNVSRETHPPAVGAWKSDPENLEKLVAALQSVFDDRLRQEKRGGDYAPQLPQASSPARRTPWTKAAPLGTKRPAMQELVVLTLGACS